MTRTHRTAVALLACITAAALAGCAPVGSAATDSTVSPSTAATQTATCATTSAADAAAAALAEVPAPSALPDAVWDPSTLDVDGYDPCAALSWALVTVEGATVSSPSAILLFHVGEYVGTATEESFAFWPEVTRTDDATLAVTYPYLEGSDVNADPTGRAEATLTWDAASDEVVLTGDTPPAG